MCCFCDAGGQGSRGECSVVVVLFAGIAIISFSFARAIEADCGDEHLHLERSVFVQIIDMISRSF